ncbi:MAG TPA: succinylglutamate desuccinylase/aspartoacylase family protein [Stellaceae bacterium]|jgi:hypothetical protein
MTAARPDPAPTGAAGSTAERERLPLVEPALGTSRYLERLRFGRRGARPKAYFQAALHADEIPGMLVLHHLAERLEVAARAEMIQGEVVLVPFANPIGLAQRISGELLGRFDLAGGGGNFNRGFPTLAAPVAARVTARLTDNAAANVAIIRDAMHQALDALPPPVSEVEQLRMHLLREAVDADIALDLHCDTEATVHLYFGTPLWPGAADLAALVGSDATLLAEESGGTPFDEAVGGPWWALAKQFRDKPIPPACLSGTLELRGLSDVDDAVAAADADALFRFLQRRGIVAGDPGPLPPLRRDATPLTGVDPVKADAAGVLVFAKVPGDEVRAGDIVAEIVRPAAGRTALRARTDGVLFARRHDRFAHPGQWVAKIAGREPLPDRTGNLLNS